MESLEDPKCLSPERLGEGLKQCECVGAGRAYTVWERVVTEGSYGHDEPGNELWQDAIDDAGENRQDDPDPVHLRRGEGKVLSESIADAACRSHRSRS